VFPPDSPALPPPLDDDQALPPDTGAAPTADPAATAGTPVAGRAGLVWWLGLAVVAADQITKALIRMWLPLYDSQTVIPGFLNLVHVRNEGMAFGLLNAADFEYKWLVTTALAGAALLGITYYARHLRPDERAARAGLSLILGGALGNLIDRLHAGHVVDFVDVYVGTWHFWAFNVADAAINVGAALVFFDLLFVRRHASDSV
jgi:signal peptidase II